MIFCCATNTSVVTAVHLKSSNKNRKWLGISPGFLAGQIKREMWLVSKTLRGPRDEYKILSCY